jgi:hypothetical protein
MENSVESPPRPDEEQPTEVALGEVYSRLFTGSSLEDLPRGGVSDRLRKFGRVYVNEQGLRELRFIIASEKGDSFAERADLKNPSQYTIAFITQGLRPIEAEISGNRINKHDLSDLVDTQLGEALGGAADKFVGPEWRLASKMLGENPYYKKPLTIIGVVDSEGKPSGLIYFGGGDQPRRPIREKVKKPKERLVIQPI